MTSPVAAGALHQRGYGQLPMRFEPNQGQTDAAVQYLARGTGYQLFLTAEEAVLVLRQGRPEPVRPEPWRPEQGDPDQKPTAEAPNTPAAIRLRLTGAARNPAPVPAGQEPLPGYSNYLIGKDPAQWRTRVPHYGKVRYGQVYPGIDLVYYGNPQQLEYDFVLAPGADPGLIQLAYAGIERLEIDAAGDLVLHVPGGRLVQQAPRIWQDIDGERHPVEGRYVLHPAGDDQIAFQHDQADDAPDAPGDDLPLVGFQLAQYRPDLPLVIDPVVLSYSTFVGGSSSDWDTAIAVDDAGQAHVTGFTYSTDFPVSSSAAYPDYAGQEDVFVAKLNAAGTDLVYATYLGGSYLDRSQGIAVDGSGNSYVSGWTLSEDFPVTAGVPGPSYSGMYDVFIARLNAEGTALDYATFLGGNRDDIGLGIAVDGSGQAYVTGYTYSSDFPVTTGAPDSTIASEDAFVVRVNPTGTAWDYATYLGGNSTDVGNGIAVDGAGRAYVTGYTWSSDFPVTSGAPDSSRDANSDDAFIVRLNATGNALDYATYLGGVNTDHGNGIAVDDVDRAYVIGYTQSSDFPVSPGAAFTTYAGGLDAFVARLNAAGTSLEYATYLGGSYDDSGSAIAVDARGLAYVTGETYSNGFPTRYAPYPSRAAFQEAFVAALTPDGRGLVYSTFLGGSDNEQGEGLALDAAGNAYVSGYTNSSDFPTTAGAFDSYLSSGEAFIAKFAIDGKLLLVTQEGEGSGMVSSTLPDGTIDCGSVCSAIYPTSTTTVRLLAGTQPLSTFAGWGGDCASAATNLTCTLTLTGDKMVSARFEPRTDDVAISQGLDLDQSQPGIDWYQAGSAPWFAQDRVTHDGIDAAQSGAIGDSQSSELEATLTGPAYLSFWWQVSSEQGWDYLTFYLDGVEKGTITGEVDWEQFFVYVPAGAHTLTWAYEKDETGKAGQDAGWLDEVVFDNDDRTLVIDPPIGGTITGAEGGSYPLGTALTLVAAPASGYYFGVWGGDCASAGLATTCELTLDINKQVSASFIASLQGGATAVAAGGGHSCAVADGGVRCWGDNDSGQLGNGRTSDSLIPLQAIPAGSGATAIAAGSTHTCAVVAGGVQCWGNGEYGRLGNGSSNSSATPVQAIPAGSGATAVAAGGSHSCAVVAGGVKCWGAGWSGRLGNGSTDSSFTPVQAIPSGKGVTAIATGDSHSCAVVDGGVKCWGDGYYGRLGNGTWDSSSTPVQAIVAGSGATAVSAGSSHSCAVVDGGVKCWGYGYYGQLGNGTRDSSSTPVQAIAAGSGSNGIAAGESHTCAVVNAGVKCWGANWSGQLGYVTGYTSSVTVQALLPGSDASAVAAGSSHSCALVGGGIQCWGGNDQGQLGDGTQNSTSVPIWTQGLARRAYVDILHLQVQGSGKVTSTPPGSDCTANCTYSFPEPTSVSLVATPGAFGTFSGWEGDCAGTVGATCHLTVAGTKTVTARFAPLGGAAALTQSLDLEGATWTASGEQPWYAQDRVTHDGVDAAQSGAIGDNQSSRLTTSLTGPGYLSFWWKVSSEAGWDDLNFSLDGVQKAVITGEIDWTPFSYYLPAGAHTLAWAYTKDQSDSAGEDAGWLDEVVFDNANRTLVIDTTTGGTISGDPAGTYPPGTVVNLTAEEVSSSFYFGGWGGDCASFGLATSCELTLNTNKQVSASFIERLQGAATDVATGGQHSCAVADGGVRCWGNNNNGQLGNGSTTASLIPLQAVPPGSGATAVAARLYHSCAVVDGGIKCWGSGASGQLGNGTYESSSTPVQAIPANSGVTAIATGYYFDWNWYDQSHSCAVVAGGVQCWGAGGLGQLGNGATNSSSIPVQTISASKGVATAVAAGGAHSCAVVDGGVKCWGAGGSGQLGNGAYSNSLTPVKAIPAGSGVTAVAAGHTHSCAVVAGGVQCWGAGENGQLGNGTTDSSSIPVQAIPAGSGATAVAASINHSCAVVNGGVKCWGGGWDGQLGHGVYASSPTPVKAIPVGSNATAVSAGFSHPNYDRYSYSCAVVAGGIQCWGANYYGQLGDGTQDTSARPQPVIGLASDLGPGITVTAMAGPGGSTSPMWANVPSGETTTFTLSPDPGFTIDLVSGCDGTLTGTSYTTGAITAPCTVSATFAAISYSISASAIPEAGGTVNCTPNPVTFGSGSLCTPWPASGYGFVNWGGDCSGTSLPCTLSNITGPRAVTANFVDVSATLSVTHSAPAYPAGGLLRVSARLDDTSGVKPLSLLWRPSLPSGWTLASVSGDGSPELSPDGTEILFSGTLPAMPLDFSFLVAVPAHASGAQTIGARVEYQNNAMVNRVTLVADPNPLTLAGSGYHSADYGDARWQIDGSEVSRVLAYWRAGDYHVEATGDDGYAPGSGGKERNRHSADYRDPFWQIDGSEANRVLAYWRAMAYHVDPAGDDGFAPGVAPAGAQSLGMSAKVAMATATATVSAGHSAPSYQPGGSLTISNHLDRPADTTLLSLLWKPNLPTGWTIASVSGDGGPELGPDGRSILFTGALSGDPLQFSYVVAVPAAASGQYSLGAQVEYHLGGAINAQVSIAQPDPLTLTAGSTEDDIIIKNRTIAGTESYQAVRTITLGGNVTVPNGASLTLQAGQRILFKPMFRVSAGGTLRARIVPVP